MGNVLKEDLDQVMAQAKGLWDPLRDQFVFMTGGTGFVGKWLLETLLCANDREKLGVHVFVLTRNPQKFSTEVPHLALHPSVRMIEGCVTSCSFPDGDFQFVIHAATAGGVQATKTKPAAAFDAEVLGTRRVLDFAATHQVKRFLFTSSGAVYGKQPSDLRQIAEDYPGAPSTLDTMTSYGQSKRASEFLCSQYARQCGFDCAIARLFAFVGPYLPLDANYAIGNFVNDVLHGREIAVQGDGRACRSYLYAADMAIWLWSILLKAEGGTVYNVGSSKEITIAALARLVADTVAPNNPVEIAGDPGVPAVRYVPAITRVERELGLRPTVSLEDGIRRMYEWNLAKRVSVD